MEIVNNSTKPKNKGGRPKGSYTKPRVSDFVTYDDARDFIAIAKKRALEDGKDDLLKFLIDHAFGKPRQNIGLDGGEDGSALVIELSEAIAKKNGLAPGSKYHS